MIATVNPGYVLLPLVLAAAAFDIFCLVDLVRADEVRYMPKWLWAVLICFVGSPISGAVYLSVGKVPGARRSLSRRGPKPNGEGSRNPR